MKSILRKNVAFCRKQLSCEEVNHKSRKIQDRLCQLTNFKESRSILFYAAYKNEVRTQEAIQKALQLNKKVLLPIVDSQDKRLILAQIFDLIKDVKEGYRGIPQPKKEKSRIVPIKDIDLVVVPGVAFDLKGNRLGYGGGYYDRLLENKSPSTVLIGLAYELQILDEIPNLPHDIKVNMVVTENRLINLFN